MPTHVETRLSGPSWQLHGQNWRIRQSATTVYFIADNLDYVTVAVSPGGEMIELTRITCFGEPQLATSSMGWSSILRPRYSAFTRGCDSSRLGAAAGNLWARTSVLPRTTADLARSAGLVPADVERQVLQLASAGLLEATQAGWTRPPHDGREAVANLRGTHGTLAVRAVAYEIERIVWAWWCSEVEWLRTRGHDRRSRPPLQASKEPIGGQGPWSGLEAWRLLQHQALARTL